MNKTKLIALAIVAFLILVPFQFAFISFSQETQLLQAVCMAIVIIGSVYAAYIFNASGSSENH